MLPFLLQLKVQQDLFLNFKDRESIITNFKKKVYMKIDRSWNNIGKSWKLLSFETKQPESWENYYKNQKEYWGERINSNLWSWKGDIKKFEKEQLSKYHKYVEDCSKWYGLFSLNEEIPIIYTNKRNVIKLCKVKNESTTWNETIELWKFNDFNLFPPSIKRNCKLYTFGVIVGSEKNKLISHYKGDYEMLFSEENIKTKLPKTISLLSGKNKVKFGITY